MIAGIFVAGTVFLLGGYFIYGRILERRYDVDPSRPTPAVTMSDGVDYVPAKVPVLFGHHFSSIAGAIPIVGPIIAAAAFGWLPPLLWIVLGAVFVGGVHDFSALVASIRHRSRSVAEIIGLYLSPTTCRLFLVFIWVALVYVLVVFVDLTATTFAPPVDNIADESQRLSAIHSAGTVATASIVYVLLALAFGFLVNTDRISLKAGSFIFVPLVFVALAVARQLPLSSTSVPALIHGDPKCTWSLILIGYCFVASIMPVWMLLQPRDYLSSFLLVACILGGGAGLVIVGGSASSHIPAFSGLYDAKLGFIFPALFITVACGAVSGFHAIIASGTTAKQLPKESAARPIAYGAMMVEAMLALVALGAIMVVKTPGATPQATFAAGMGKFLSVFGVSPAAGASFALLALSTFLLTTLDTCTRLGRYILEELTGLRGTKTRLATTLVTLAIPVVAVLIRVDWRAVYPVFGSANQLLAVFALLAILVWRLHAKKSFFFVLWPMILMLATTITQLVKLIIAGIAGQQTALITALAGVLLAIALAILIDTIRSWGKITAAKPVEEEAEVVTV